MIRFLISSFIVINLFTPCKAFSQNSGPYIIEALHPPATSRPQGTSYRFALEGSANLSKPLEIKQRFNGLDIFIFSRGSIKFSGCKEGIKTISAGPEIRQTRIQNLCIRPNLADNPAGEPNRIRTAISIANSYIDDKSSIDFNTYIQRVETGSLPGANLYGEFEDDPIKKSWGNTSPHGNPVCTVYGNTRESELQEFVIDRGYFKEDFLCDSLLSDNYVRLVETALSKKGLNPGVIDGKSDLELFNAIRSFQKLNELENSGRLNVKTVKLLEIPF